MANGHEGERTQWEDGKGDHHQIATNPKQN
jgi:hypothetical protein